MYIAGPTKAGKTVFVKRLIENKEFMINQHIDKVTWFYSENQPLYDSLRGKVDFIEGVPDVNQLKDQPNASKIVGT